MSQPPLKQNSMVGQALSREQLQERLQYEKDHPENAAATDAAIRSARPSVGARIMVGKIREAVAAGKTREQIEAEFPREKEAYSALFGMLLDPRHLPGLVDAILDQLESIETGVKATHDASVYWGTLLANHYVMPVVEKPPLPLPN